MNVRFKVAAAVAVTLVTASPATAAGAGSKSNPRPETITLPDGFVGEGVATGAHDIFYAGSVADGRIARGNLRTGEIEVFVPAPAVASATGLKADLRHQLLWVAGAMTGRAAVYDLKTGAEVANLMLAAGNSFINDVVVTRDAAYFTDSFAPVIYRVPVSRSGVVGQPAPITITGPAAELPGQFNNNGIEATPDGRTLIVVNTTSGQLFTIDARTGASSLIDLGGGSVPSGDGILLVGQKLLVLQNGIFPDTQNQIAVVKLGRHLTTGRIVDTISSLLFENATTLARNGGTLVAVNSQFNGAPIDPEPEIVVLRH